MANSNLEQRVERLEELVSRLVERDNPWAKFAGVWKDDPTFGDFLAAIAEHRREVDSAFQREDDSDEAGCP